MADRSSPVDKETNSNEEGSFQTSELINSSNKNTCVIKNKRRKILQNKSIMSNVRKPKFNYDDLKHTKVNIACNITPQMKTFAIDPLDGECSVEDSGSFFKKEEFSECKILHSCNGVNKSSISKNTGGETSSANEEQKSKERIIKDYESTGESEQNPSGVVSEEKEFVLNKSSTRSQDVKPVFNADDIKKIIADLSRKRKKNMSVDKASSCKHVDEEQRIWSREPESTEEILSGVVSEEKEFVLNKSSTRSQDVKPVFNADDIKKIIADLSRKRKKNMSVDKASSSKHVDEEQRIWSRESESTEEILSSSESQGNEIVRNDCKRARKNVKSKYNRNDPENIVVMVISTPKNKLSAEPQSSDTSVLESGTLVNREEYSEYEIIDKTKEIDENSVAEYEDQQFGFLDKERQTKEIDVTSSVGINQSLSGVVSEDKEFVLNKSSTRSHVVKPVFNTDDIKKIIADLSRKRKKNMSVDKASSSKHVNEKQRIWSRVPESTKEILRKSSSGSRSTSRRYSRSQLRYRRHRYSSYDDDGYIYRNRPRSRCRTPIRHGHDRHAYWTDSNEDKRLYKTLKPKNMTNFKRPFYDRTFGYRPFPPIGSFFPRVRRPSIYQPGVLPPSRVEKPFPPPEIARPFPPTGPVFQRVREPLIRPKRPFSSLAATESSQSGVLPPSRVEKPFPHLATTWSNQSSDLPSSGVEKPFPPPAAPGGNRSGTLPSSSTARPFPSRAVTWGKESGDLSSSGVGIPFPATSGGNQSGTLPSSRTAELYPFQAPIWGNQFGYLPPSRVEKPFPPPEIARSFPPTGPIFQRVREPLIRPERPLFTPVATEGSQSEVLLPSRVERPFPHLATKWSNQSSDLPSSGVKKPFPPPAAPGGNWSGTLPSSRTARPFPSRAVTWGKESGDLSSSGVGIPFPATSGGNRSGTLPSSRTAELYPFRAPIWGNKFGYLPPSGVEVLFPPPATSGDNQSGGTLPPSRKAGPFPSLEMTLGNQSGNLSSSRVGIPFHPLATLESNQFGDSSHSGAARQFSQFWNGDSSHSGAARQFSQFWNDSHDK